MITIDHPSVQTEGDTVTISYPILQDGQAPRTLSFTVDSRFRDFLDPRRADGALVALLPSPRACTTSAYDFSPIF